MTASYIQQMVKKSRRLDRPGARIAFEDTGGDGTVVVLTHGAGMSRAMFAPQVEALRRAGYRVLSWDLRGHGESPLMPGAQFRARDALEDLAALLHEGRVERAVLVGHSLGGNLSQAFARIHAERVRGLIVMDSTWNAGPVSALERIALRLAAPALACIPSRMLPGLMARASAVDPSVVARAETAFARMSKRDFLHVWRATVSLVDPDPGFRSPVPLALLRGERDGTGNIAQAMPRWAEAEGIEEHVIPGAGHIVTWDAPEATSEALLGILGGWGAAARSDGSSGAPG